MKAVKNAVRATIVIATLAAAHASVASTASHAIAGETATAPTTTAAAEPTASAAALSRILDMSHDQVAMATMRGRSWVQMGEPWMQWRAQVKRAVDDAPPTGDVFESFSDAQV